MQILCHVYTKYDKNGNSRKGWIYLDDEGNLKSLADDGRGYTTLEDVGFTNEERTKTRYPSIKTTPAYFKALMKNPSY